MPAGSGVPFPGETVCARGRAGGRRPVLREGGFRFGSGVSPVGVSTSARRRGGGVWVEFVSRVREHLPGRERLDRGRGGGGGAYRVRVGDRPAGGAPDVNDPSAGSPTETSLRLLLPLDSQV